MTIDLNKFCSKAGTRYHIARPFSKGGRSYATNGHIAVRVPRIDGIAENPQAPDVEKLFQRQRHVTQWVDVPKVTIERKPCGLCGGKGTWSDDDEPEEQCEDCEGAKTVEVIEAVRFEVDGVVIGLSNLYLDLIRRELPSPKLGLHKDAASMGKISTDKTAVEIKFDGGDGLLMPIRF